MQQSFPCPYCGSPNPPGQRFCGACGARVVATCPYCQAIVDPKRRFCPNCGTDLLRGRQQQTEKVVMPMPVQDRLVQGTSRIKMHWFQRHLNWTLFLVYTVVTSIFTMAVAILRVLPSVLLEVRGLVVAGYLLIIFLISGWVIKRKRRSLFHLLWLLIPFSPLAIAILIGLKNRSLKESHE